MVNSRTKGRGGEHETCGYLNDNVGSVLGCKFKRNLSQTQRGQTLFALTQTGI